MKLQIWDFNLGQSREPEDCSRMEAAYDTKDAASFTINSFAGRMNEACSTKAKGVKEISQVVYVCFSFLSCDLIKTLNLCYYSLSPFCEAFVLRFVLRNCWRQLLLLVNFRT